MKKILLYIIPALLVAACSVKEEMPADGGETVFYGNAYGADGSRITIGEPYSQGGTTWYKGLWESGDAIKVYRVSDGAHLGNATLNEGAGSQNGKFTLPTSIGNADVRIIYPSSAYYDGVHSLAQNQSQTGAGSAKFASYSFAYSEVTNQDAGNNFTLQHVPAFLKVVVKAASTSDTWYGATLSSLTFRVPGAVLSGQFTVDYETGELTPGETVYDYVKVTLDNPVTLGTSEQEIWLAALPSDLTGCLVTVSLALSKNSSSTNAMVKFTGRPLLSNSVNTLRITSLESIIEPGNPSATEYTTVTVQARTNSSSTYNSYTTRTLAGMNRMDKFLVDTRDAWGGYKGVKPDHITSTNSEGFWRTGTYHGRPMFVDPAGNVSFLYGVNGITPDPLSDAADSRTTAYYNAKFASVYDWAVWNAGNAANYGFNFFNNSPKRIRNYRMDNEIGLGISAEAQQRLYAGNNSSKLSQTENLYMLRTFLWDYYSITKKSLDTAADSPFLLMFDPDWLDYIYKLALKAAEWFKDEPNFIGYYTDNELPICETNSTYKKAISLENFLEQEEDYSRCAIYAKAWAEQWMMDNYGTTTYSSSMETPFVKAVMEYYFRTTAEAIRAADPNHLVMGCRLFDNSKQTQGVVEACARYHDVITFNFYGYWDVSTFTKLSSIKSWAGGKPALVTEFYVKNANQTAPDGTAYKNNEGAGWWVKSQEDRGKFYQNNVIRFIQDGTLGGWKWFKWTDDYRNTVPGWINKGLVVPDYSGTYTACTSLMKEMHWNLYQCLDYYWGAPESSGRLAGDLPEGIWE